VCNLSISRVKYHLPSDTPPVLMVDPVEMEVTEVMVRMVPPVEMEEPSKSNSTSKTPIC
jgi:hypothetical protein